ncbi:WD40-repeat-containing domain [Arabidopsis suecica]|uniref:WD40-repeat-containing domain n=1 Tax=Arabidopsis suecica TaxID=45249 RepID=A0A8T2DQ82_ARASU|nr:WD40-repeat-containing domain [Arabidopsis suecica]
MIQFQESEEEPDFSQEDHLTSSSQPLHQCIATLVCHTASYISSLTLAGKRLYTGSNDGVVRLWNANTLETLAEASSNGDVITGERGGGGAVKSLVILADKLFTAHQDHKIRVWKINDVVEEDVGGKKYMHLATMPTISDRFAKCLMPKNQVEIRRHKKASWVHHVDAVSGLALSRDGTLLYSVSWDRTLKIWRTTDFKCLESFTNAHDDAINAVALSENGDIYTGSSDQRIKVWRKNINEENVKKKRKHSLVAILSEHNSGINALALSGTNGSLLHSGGSDGSILVWERDDGGDIVVVGMLRGHTESVLCLAVVSNILCSGSADKTVRLWKCSAKDYSCLAMLEGHLGPVKCLTGAFRDSRKADEASYHIYSGGLDSQVKVWQVLVPA